MVQGIQRDNTIEALAVRPFKSGDHLLAGQRNPHHAVAAVELKQTGGAQQVSIGPQAQLLAGLLELVIGYDHQLSIDVDAGAAHPMPGGEDRDDVLIHSEVLGAW